MRFVAIAPARRSSYGISRRWWGESNRSQQASTFEDDEIRRTFASRRSNQLSASVGARRARHVARRAQGSRLQIQRPLRRQMPPLPSIYCLFVKSRLVAMGISLARLAMGGTAQHVEVVTTRDAYRAKLEAAVRHSLADAGINAASGESTGRSPASSEDGSDAR